MSEPIKPNPTQTHDDDQVDNEQRDVAPEKPCHLKLVVSNPSLPPPEEEKPFKDDPNAGFTVDIYQEGDAHTLRTCDHFHRLLCRVLLEIDDQEADGEIPPSRSVLCDFPCILGEEYNEFEDLNSFLQKDENLFGMILIQFQMKTLEQMLLFASDHDASTLVIRTNNAGENNALGLYQSLAIYVDKVPTIRGTNTQLVIPTNEETFDKLVELIDQVNQKFRQTLWREQRNNPFIRWYLKKDPLLKSFS